MHLSSSSQPPEHPGLASALASAPLVEALVQALRANALWTWRRHLFIALRGKALRGKALRAKALLISTLWAIVPDWVGARKDKEFTLRGCAVGGIAPEACIAGATEAAEHGIVGGLEAAAPEEQP
eukprot:CAMPEP_0170578680 /NCGR_PEP_ID=MMETSP0224-20130122/5583_1 /TAXON_ID=285029 /ORGANISM="Togula jolla, Strain CCCM 725" /LENGTH=124 /DNA_ID=CAMNT_0010901661 /DNA_START=232 /DNA_END=608 /DNA_ORIENTATION=-